MIRTIEQWKEILDGLTPMDAAKKIMGDLTHYYHDRPHEVEDRKQLAVALLAFRELG